MLDTKEVVDTTATIDPWGVVAKVTKKASATSYTSHPTVPGPLLALSPVRRESQHIPLKALFDQRSAYTIPDFQREYIWPTDYQALFIQTVLYGFPCDPIKVIRHMDATGTLFQYVIDGQQRFTTLMRFMNNEFKTPTAERLAHISPNSKIPPLEPGLFYRQLSAPLKSRVDSYALEFIFMENVPEAWWADIFSNWQNHRTLGLGHQLWARSNTTADMAKTLSDYHKNMLWSSVYKRPSGKTREVGSDPERMRFLSALSALAIEATGEPWMVGLRKVDLKRWGNGIYDEKITADVLARVYQRFGGITQVCSGAEATTKLDMILMMQVACLLEDQEGYSLAYSKHGCLVPWYNQLRTLRRVAGKRAFSPVSFLGEAYEQRRFWDEQLPLLVAQAEVLGLVKATQVDEAYRAELATSGAW